MEIIFNNPMKFSVDFGLMTIKIQGEINIVEAYDKLKQLFGEGLKDFTLVPDEKFGWATTGFAQTMSGTTAATPAIWRSTTASDITMNPIL